VQPGGAHPHDPGPAFEFGGAGHAVAKRDRTEDRLHLHHRTRAQRRCDAAAVAERGSLPVRLFGQPLDFDLEDLRWTLGGFLDLPVNRLPERNVYRATLIDRELALRNVEQLADTIVADVRLDLRQLNEARQDFEIQQNAVRLARRRIESTELNLQAGRATTRDLLEAQQALVEAENATTQALIDYTLARLRLYGDIELVRLDERGLTVVAPPLPDAAEEVPVTPAIEGGGGPSEDPLLAPGWRP
jgi:hypothetical protein